MALALIFMFSLELSGQQLFDTESKKAIQYYMQSENFYVKRQYREALGLLNQALKKDENFTQAHFRIAACYKHLNDLESAAFHYGRVIELNQNDTKSSSTFLALGEVQFFQEEYQASAESIEKFISLGNPDDKRMSKARRLFSNAEFASEGVKAPLSFNPQPLPDNVNRFPLQYFPVLTADQGSLLFTARLELPPSSMKTL